MSFEPNVDQRIALGFLENDHGPAQTHRLATDDPLRQELMLQDGAMLAEFATVRFIIDQDGGMIPLRGRDES